MKEEASWKDDHFQNTWAIELWPVLGSHEDKIYQIISGNHQTDLGELGTPMASWKTLWETELEKLVIF